MEYQKITKVSNENDQEMTEERYIYLEIDNLR